jgi:hypothetical protein
VRRAALLLCGLAARPAFAEEEAAPPPDPLRVAVSGYLQPQAVVKHRPDAVPRDRWEYGVGGSRAGIALGGEPLAHLRWVVHVVAGAQTIDVVTAAEPVDGDGDGEADDVLVERQATATLEVEEATVRWVPAPLVEVVFGRLRIPLTVEAASPNTELMFPQRAGPNEVFLSGSDLGLMGVLHLDAAHTTASVGVWNGTGREPSPGQEGGRGLAVSARADWASGEFPLGEADVTRGGPRVALGAGLLFRQSVGFDAAGNDGAEIRDLRLAGSVRFAALGFLLQAEFLRRQTSDNLSSRTRAATGAYGQASYYVPAGPVAFAPLARVGWSREDEEIAPRETLYLEAGVAFYPSSEKPDLARVLAAYVGENRKTEGEDAKGAVVQVQVTF